MPYLTESICIYVKHYGISNRSYIMTQKKPPLIRRPAGRLGVVNKRYRRTRHEPSPQSHPLRCGSCNGHRRLSGGRANPRDWGRLERRFHTQGWRATLRCWFRWWRFRWWWWWCMAWWSWWCWSQGQLTLVFIGWLGGDGTLG
jgi:hypothetical protein